MSGSSSNPPPAAVAAPALTVADARRMYARVLGSWVMDLTHLRATGLDRPSYRRTNGDLPAPAWQTPYPLSQTRSRTAA
ncbi:MAG: hypothetical protein KGS45_07315 [Planctomycetes bacterium]|nr:hypothetical protein [Planctomycetota bacterium]